MVSVYAISSPTGKISPQPWLTAPETRTVVEALTADGVEVRFVGGCVRDAMARRPVTDVDIGTPDKPETVIGWHRKGFGLFWTWKSRRGKPAKAPWSRPAVSR